MVNNPRPNLKLTPAPSRAKESRHKVFSYTARQF
nr:MAG TPA: hypothetical protein [Caudoviricetes sp.]